WAFPAVMPEALHNIAEAVRIGVESGGWDASSFHLVLLEDRSRPFVTRVRFDALQDLLSDAGITWTRLTFDGTSDLSILLQACVLGDWVSYYLAVDDGVDPSPVPTISLLKQDIAQRLAVPR